jgi:hypothetical protein
VVPDELGDADSVAGSDKPALTDPKHKDSYAVPAFEQARRHQVIVDNWAHQVDRAAQSPAHDERLQNLRLDGERLGAAFARVAAQEETRSAPMMAVGPRLASQELQIRLKNIAVN